MAMYKIFSLLNVLCSVINSSEYSSLDSMLAHYLIDNFERISELNIYDVASQCYCTRKSVSRFCNKIGFPSFSALKNYSIRYKHIQWQNLNRLNVPDFKNSLMNQIDSVMENINLCIDRGELDEMADLIHKSDSIMFLTDDSNRSLLSSFQRSMTYCHKVVKIVSNTLGGDSMLKNMFELYKKNSNLILDSLGEEDLIITISITGYFASATKDIISLLNAKTVLVTLNHDLSTFKAYDRIYYLSEEDHAHEGINAYSVYGLNYYLDNLLSIYFNKYGDKALIEEQPKQEDETE